MLAFTEGRRGACDDDPGCSRLTLTSLIYLRSIVWLLTTSRTHPPPIVTAQEPKPRKVSTPSILCRQQTLGDEALVVLVGTVAEVWKLLLGIQQAFVLWKFGFFPYARKAGLFRVSEIREGAQVIRNEIPNVPLMGRYRLWKLLPCSKGPMGRMVVVLI